MPSPTVSTQKDIRVKMDKIETHLQAMVPKWFTKADLSMLVKLKLQRYQNAF